MLILSAMARIFSRDRGILSIRAQSILKTARPKRGQIIIIGLLLVFFSLNGLFAQAAIIAFTSNITGVVVAANSNEILPQVEVTIETEGTILSVLTDSQGRYSFSDISCAYPVVIRVNQEGYQPFQAAVSVACYKTLEYQITLQPNLRGTDPVILIPGIMGSWNRNLLDLNPEMPDEWILDPFFHTYDRLLEELQTTGGYVLNENLFTLPYDWRQKNEYTAQRLADRLAEIRQQTGATKVDVIAHSMGGLIARYYIETDLYQNDIDQLIFIATPQRGAPKAYLAWGGGYLGTNMVSDLIKELLIARLAKHSGLCNYTSASDCVHEYIHLYPVASLQQLLPDYDYLRNSDSGLLRAYPNGYPSNHFLEYLNNPENLAKLYSSNIEMSVIYNSTPASTIESYSVVLPTGDGKWLYGRPDGFSWFNRSGGVSYGNGDETVPVFSSRFINSELFINKLDTDHSKIVSASITNVIEILKNEYIQIKVVEPVNDYIIIGVYSPVDLLVKTPSGLLVGRERESSQDVNQVEQSYYAGAGALNEYIIIPVTEQGEYKIFTQGTAAGDFSLEVAYLDDNGLNKQTVVGQTTPGRIGEYNITVDEQAVSRLVPADQTPPRLEIISPAADNYLHNQLLPIDYLVTDAESGVNTSWVYVDKEIYSPAILDLFEFSLGEHTLAVSATDWAGNTASTTIVFKVIANFQSLRADIERLWQTQDIKNKFIKIVLLKQVDWLEKWYTEIKPQTLINQQQSDRWPGEYFDYSTKQWLPRLLGETLARYEKLGFITTKARKMLTEQFTYLIAN